MGSVVEQSRSDCSTTLPAYLPVNTQCDGCSTRAAYEIRLPSGRTLILCGHHTKRHFDALANFEATILPLENP